MNDMKTIKGIFLYFLLIASLLAALTSCTTFSPASPPLKMSWKERQLKLKRLNTWNIQGVIAIHATSNSGSATLNWQQTHQNYVLALFGPLGMGSIQIQGQPGNVLLRNAQGQEYRARSPEQLLHDQTGWDLPISSLYYWVRGLPAPGPVSKYEFDAYHRIAKLTQQNWQIYFRQYGRFHQNELPTKIELVHPGLKIKLVIYEWL
jgi:outer membrane lipoprotein LolB